MTGVEPASFGLKDRCITGLLHTLTSHTWRWAVIGLESIFQGPKSRVLTIYTRPQVQRWIRTIPNGVADHPDHQVLRTDRSRVRTAHNKNACVSYARDGQCSSRTNSCGASNRRCSESAYCPDHPNGTRTRISTLRGWPPVPVSKMGRR